MQSPSVAVIAQKYDDLVVEFSKLSKEHRKLQHQHSQCEAWNNQCYEKYKAAKDACRKWQIWYDNHQRAAGIDPSARISSSTIEAPTGEQSSNRVSSSQTTEGEEDPDDAARNEVPSDDEPQVVSARSLKRKRVNANDVSPRKVQIKQEDANSPDNPIRVLSDDYSSPVLKRQKPTRAETSDLDALVQRMDTPRKRRRQRGSSEELKQPAPLPTQASSVSDGGLPHSHRTLDAALEPTIPDLAHHDPTVRTRDFAVHSGTENALRPRSANIPGSSKTSGLLRLPKSKQTRQDRHKMRIVSEDGEYTKSQAASDGPTPDNNVKRRLGALLEEATPDRQPLAARRPAASTAPRPRDARDSPKRKHAKETPKPKVPYQYKTPLGLGPPPPDARPEDEPLRSRPLRRLCLDDFKINPEFLGTDFAFSETFRGREARGCLPGCTKPECCGNAFRKVIEIGGMSTNKTDAEVLEAYLGSDFEQVLTNYSPSKRKDLLLEAHANQLANKFGKHRQAYERAASPPGFWRVDMPTTQEAEEDRARARDMEQKKIEERWREAMRDGGRWLFRDE